MEYWVMTFGKSNIFPCYHYYFSGLKKLMFLSDIRSFTLNNFQLKSTFMLFGLYRCYPINKKGEK